MNKKRKINFRNVHVISNKNPDKIDVRVRYDFKFDVMRIEIKLKEGNKKCQKK